MLKVTFLGTGTSHGVPMIGCQCNVCCSDNPKNKRYRSAILVENARGKRFLVDTPPEFRLQCLRFGIEYLDAVFLTHCHADHIFGFDDLRRFNQLMGKEIPCYGSEATIKEFRRIFSYIFRETQLGGGKPLIDTKIMSEPAEIDGTRIIPVSLLHGEIPVTGYRFGNFAYLTDCSFIPEESFALLDNLDLLVLGALRFEAHPTHFNLEQAIEAVKRLKPKKAYFTHIAHAIEHETVNALLPDNIELAYDGLVIEC